MTTKQTEMSTKPETQGELLPCPFCGAGTTQIRENGKVWLGMRYSEPSSVSVQHWCESISGQPSRMLERVGKDMESALAAWNMRAAALLAANDKSAELDAEHNRGFKEGYRAALLAADDRAGGEAVKFLCNGTRFKMAFFDDGDDEDYGGTIHVKCFNNFEKELDGRWVALVAAEDDCHLKYTHPQPQAEAVRVPLTHEQITRAARALCKKTAETCGTDADDEWKIYGESYKEQALIALEAAHGIAKDQAL